MEKLIVSSSPHITGKQDTQSIMRDVLIALVPTVLVGIWVFGLRALTMVLISVLSACVFEGLWNYFNKKDHSLYELSAAVTGTMVALILPTNSPWWIFVLASGFAIIIAKQLFGGLGQNFINPALAGRAFVVASWPLLTTVFVKLGYDLPLFATVEMTDAITGATPLYVAKTAHTLAPYSDLFVGKVPGCIGETSVIAILIGGIYLVARRVITLHAPISYIVSVGIFGYIFGYQGLFTGDVFFSIFSGGVVFGAFFMITDYVTTPTTKAGQVIAGIIAGFLTIIIRVKGGYPEGVSYAIMLVNVITPLIDKYVSPKKYGRVAKNG